MMYFSLIFKLINTEDDSLLILKSREIFLQILEARDTNNITLKLINTKMIFFNYWELGKNLLN